MPTSMTTAPWLDPVAAHHLGAPDRGDEDVGPTHASAGRSRLREWAIVTVQLSCSSNCAIGLPTMLERPMTSASRPASPSGSARADQQQAAGRRARHQRPVALADGEAADIDRMESRRHPWPDRSPRAPPWSSICDGSGSCTRMPSIAASALSAATRSTEDRPALVSTGKRVLDGMEAELLGLAALGANIDLARRHPRRRGPRRDPGARWPFARGASRPRRRCAR